MKKLKNFLHFSFISLLVLAAMLYLGQLFFKFVWNFNIFHPSSYKTIYEYWEAGGVFNTFRDCSLIATLFFIFPIIWLVLSRKLHKYGLLKFLVTPIIKIYRHITNPKSMEPEYVSIKNMGGKDLSLDEIIAEKLKENGTKSGSEHTVKNLRQQIAAKIEENENK